MTATARLAASVLLRYPDRRLYERLPALRDTARRLPRGCSDPLLALVDHLARRPLRDAAVEYTATFDFDRSCCLYLTYFTHGDTRGRGTALDAFTRAYGATGPNLDDGQQPDYLPVVLEFAGTTKSMAGEALLRAHRAPLELIRRALAGAGSPYRYALDAVCATLSACTADELAMVDRFSVTGPPRESVGLERSGGRR